MKKFLKLFVLFPLLFVSCAKTKTSASFTAMNTFMSVQVYASSSAAGKNACKTVEKEIVNLENILSTTITESDIYKINSLGNGFVPVHPQVKELLEFSFGMYEKTSGLFNPALYPIIKEWGFTTESYGIPSQSRIDELLPLTDFSKIYIQENQKNQENKDENLPFRVCVRDNMQLDFGAVAKGYAGDVSIELLKNLGIKSALLNFGGNVQALGRKDDGSLWKIGVKNPWNDSPACFLNVQDCAVITSGGYERFFIGEDGNKYIHIFDPRTGRPAKTDLESVTIICPKGIYADALSTSLFVMGKDSAVDFWKKTKDFDFILITKDRELVYSCGLEENIGFLYDFKEIIKID